MLQTLTIPLQIVLQLAVSNDSETRNITFVADTPLPNYSPAILDGWTTFPDLGIAYKHLKYGATWNLARKDCAARGANLAVIDSFKKIDYVKGMLQRGIGSWVGTHRLFDNVEWVSLKTGSPLATIPWERDEPASAGVNEKCAGLWDDGRGLFSSRCNVPYHFLCEIELQRLQIPLGTVIVN